MSNLLVTALFDINRKKYDGRSMDQYLEWIQETLRLRCDFTIFTEEKFANKIWSYRESSPYKTTIVIQSPEEIPYYRYYDKISKILQNTEYQKRISRPDRIECQNPLYNIIQYSKFEWIVSAITQDYQNYFWIDAGCSRFFGDFDLNRIWPNIYLPLRDLLIQGNVNSERIFGNWIGNDNYIWESECALVGTLFGGSPQTMEEISQEICKLFEHYLERNVVNNEQILLAILFMNRYDLFNIRLFDFKEHLPLFKHLG